MLRYISSPFKWFFKLEAASGLVLLFAAIIALIVSNSNFKKIDQQDFNYSDSFNPNKIKTNRENYVIFNKLDIFERIYIKI